MQFSLCAILSLPRLATDTLGPITGKGQVFGTDGSCIVDFRLTFMNSTLSMLSAFLRRLAKKFSSVGRIFSSLKDKEKLFSDFNSMGRHREKTLFLPRGHLNFESAVTAQSDEFIAVFIARLQYLASILSNSFVKCICRNISCALENWSLHSR